MKSGTGVNTVYTLISSYTGSLHENSRLYTSREYDKEVLLYFNRARYYSPSTGKFISRDPIGQNDQINLYTYVGNSPMMYVDLRGKASKRIIQIFRESQKVFREYQELHDTPLVNNDYEYDLNSFYFEQQFQGSFSVQGIEIFNGNGNYDLAYGGKGVKEEYEQDGNGNILFDGQEIGLGEIANVLTALNASRLGLSQNHLEFGAMETVKRGTGNGVEGEMADRELYNYGYSLGIIEERDGFLSDDEIINAIKAAVRDRANYTKSTSNK